MLLALESRLFLFVIYFTLSGRIEAIPLNDFYQFGVAAGDTALDRSDTASPEIAVPAFNFFGRSFESLFVRSLYPSNFHVVDSSSNIIRSIPMETYLLDQVSHTLFLLRFL